MVLLSAWLKGHGTSGHKGWPALLSGGGLVVVKQICGAVVLDDLKLWHLKVSPCVFFLMDIFFLTASIFLSPRSSSFTASVSKGLTFGFHGELLWKHVYFTSSSNR